MTIQQTPHADTHEQARAVSEARAFLARHHCLGLATAGPSGVSACTVFYVNREFDFYFLSSGKTRHAENIEADPRVAGTIHDDVADWISIRGVQLEGVAERVDDARRSDVLELFALRYPFPEVFWWADDDVVPRSEQRIYVVHTARLFFFDHGIRNTRFEVPSELLPGARSDAVPLT